jgi:hypothetical protein
VAALAAVVLGVAGGPVVRMAADATGAGRRASGMVNQTPDRVSERAEDAPPAGIGQRTTRTD